MVKTVCAGSMIGRLILFASSQQNDEIIHYVCNFSVDHISLFPDEYLFPASPKDFLSDNIFFRIERQAFVLCKDHIEPPNVQRRAW